MVVRGSTCKVEVHGTSVYSKAALRQEAIGTVIDLKVSCMIVRKSFNLVVDQPARLECSTSVYSKAALRQEAIKTVIVLKVSCMHDCAEVFQFKGVRV